jgi:hypothetical protein
VSGSRGCRLVIRCSVWALVIVCVIGCGGSGRPKTIPISGKITIDGQPLNERGKLHFQAVEAAAGYSKRPANGFFDVDGSYRVMSWELDDGLVPGHYTVSFLPGDPAKTRIPAKYKDGSTSGLKVDVPMDQGSVEYNIAISSK